MSDTVTITESPTTVTVTDNTGSSETVSVSSESVTVVTVGTQGPTGPQGAAGSGGDLTYTQNFSNASSVTVTHNLNKYPAVSVLDSAGDEVEGDIDYTSLNEVVLSFSANFSGMVTCN